jgi:hypothetical protein
LQEPDRPPFIYRASWFLQNRAREDGIFAKHRCARQDGEHLAGSLIDGDEAGLPTGQPTSRLAESLRSKVLEANLQMLDLAQID